MNVRDAQEIVQIAVCDAHDRVAAFGDTTRDFAAYSRYLALKLAQPRLVRVLLYHRAQS